MIATANVLEFDRVSRGFTKDKLVLNDVSFTMQREEIVALLGRNGAGKTTMVNLAMGLLAPQRGSVKVFGMSPMEEPVRVKRRVGYVSEHSMLPMSFTVRDAIDFHRKLYTTWDVAFERTLLDRFGLNADMGRRLGRLSKGQRQQVSLLCAVCHRPELLLLDEPAAGLDPATRREFLETSIQLLNREGTAILFSTPHMSDVERLGGRVLLLHDARLAFDESLDALRELTSLVIVPRRVTGVADRLRAMPGVIRVRTVVDEWHAIVRGAPSDVERGLAEQLGTHEAHCSSLPLEELFIEYAGGQRSESVGA